MATYYYEYIESMGYLNGRRIGKVLADGYNKSMSKKINDHIPVLAADGFTLELRGGHKHGDTIKTFEIPIANIRFLIDKGEESEVVASVRLGNDQIEKLLDELNDKLNTFRSGR